MGGGGGGLIIIFLRLTSLTFFGGVEDIDRLKRAGVFCQAAHIVRHAVNLYMAASLMN